MDEEIIGAAGLDIDFELVDDQDEELKDGNYPTLVRYLTAETSNSKLDRTSSTKREGFQNLNAVEWWRFAIRSVIKDNRSKNG